MKNILALILIVWLTVLTAFIAYDKTSDKVVFIDLVEVHDGFELTKQLTEEYEAVKHQQQQIMDSLVLKKHFEDESKNMEYLRNCNNQFMANLEKLSTSYNNKIWKRINQYVGDYGKEYDFNFVLGTKGDGGVMYSKATADKTDEVLLYINKRYEGSL